MKRNILISIDEGWTNASWEKLEHEGKVEIYRNLFSDFKGIRKFLLELSKSGKLKSFPSRYCQIFFVGYIIKKLNLNHDDEIAILVYHLSGASDLTVLYRALKKRYPNIKIGYLFSNVMSKCFDEKNEKYYVNEIKRTFDKVYAFDKNDAHKYITDFSYLIYEPIKKECFIKKSDVFLVAKGKDRVKEILEVYNKCKKEDLIIDFYVNDLSKADLEILKGADLHQNEVLSYDEVVEKLLESKCIVDIMQKGSRGVTLNICEAIIYNKKIITDNIYIKEEPFYNENMIYILGERVDSLQEFLNSPSIVYSEKIKSLFSGIPLFENLRI